MGNIGSFFVRLRYRKNERYEGITKLTRGKKFSVKIEYN